jgi:translation initiation factor IF-1
MATPPFFHSEFLELPKLPFTSFPASLSSLFSLMAEQVIETDGTIVAVLAGTMFRVALANQHVVLAHISGKMRKRWIRLTLGDRVKLEMSPYDLEKARIVYRL